jgi:iron complex transport system ATP-binding protein
MTIPTMPAAANPSEPILELIDAVVLRGRTRALDGFTLRIERGEHTAILGPNGAGKSSLMRVLTHEDRPVLPADGQPPPLRLFGRERWDLTELRSHLGVVTGDLDAGFGMSTSRGRVVGLDVAVSGLLGSHGVFAHHAVTDAMREQGRVALERVEAMHLASKPLREMSTGERRRVLIARALVTDPIALLLDEPTTGLDFVARHRFMQSVRRLARAGTTVVIVTHHIEEVVPEMQRVVLIDRGRVVVDGAPDDVLTPGHLGRVFGAPLTVQRTGASYQVHLEP